MLRPADVWTMARAPEGTAVLIRPAGSDVAVQIFVDHCIAQSIYIALRGERQSRPLTHDLFLQTLAALKVTVERVEITDIKPVGGNGTFFARLVLLQDGQQVEIDSRTSDAIAIALRAKCPIFIDEDVVEQAAIPVSTVESGEASDGDEEDAEADEGDPVGKLKRELAIAVQEENYEEAARLRDRITELEGSS
jgi:bifunctional DNase/RNase